MFTGHDGATMHTYQISDWYETLHMGFTFIDGI